ncbi:MAG: hypothetical protein RL078_56 [Bacteroidota bacterium]|jgi:hypothetical protein
MSDTPETDAKSFIAFDTEGRKLVVVLATTSESFERERDEANEDLHKQLVQYDQLFDEAEKIRIERDEARDAIVGCENKWKFAIDMAARAELERDDALEEIRNLKIIIDYIERKANE